MLAGRMILVLWRIGPRDGRHSAVWQTLLQSAKDVIRYGAAWQQALERLEMKLIYDDSKPNQLNIMVLESCWRMMDMIDGNLRK